MDIDFVNHLKENAQGTLELIHTMENFLVIVDFSGKILLASDALFEKTEVQKENFYQEKFSKFFIKKDQKPLNFFDLTLLDNHGKQIEVNFYEKDGSPVESLLISSSILQNYYKDQDYLLLLFADMREQRKAQMQLMHSNKMVSLGEMATNIAHEVNNPLAIIEGQLRMLTHSLNSLNVDVTRPLSIVEKMEKNFFRINKIINSLRTISRKEEDHPFNETKLSEIFDAVKDLSEQRLSMKDINFSIDGLKKDHTIYCRQTEILQVFLNLINNSIDSIEDNLTRWVKVKIVEGKDGFEFYFIDSGSGINLDTQIRLFEPFYTTKDIGKGTGLGLSISKGLIEAHEGTLSYDDTNTNTCFKITLPFKQKGNPNSKKDEK